MKGFLFTPEMAVAACRDVGPKTVTRRVIIPQPSNDFMPTVGYYNRTLVDKKDGAQFPDPKARFGASDENEDYPCDYRPFESRCLLTTWAVHMKFDKLKPTQLPNDLQDWGGIWHAGEGTLHPTKFGKLRPGRFLPNHLRPLMPVLEVVSVRAERVQDITDADAEAEGIGKSWPNYAHDPRIHWEHNFAAFDSARGSFASLWDSINAKRGFGWSANPWVWVVGFRRVAP